MSKILTYFHTLDETDFLIDYSIDLANDLHKAVDFLHTVDLQNYPMGMPAAARPNFEYTQAEVDKIIERLDLELDKKFDKVKTELEKPPAMNWQVRQGIGHHVIKDFVDENKYDFVIAATDKENDFLINDRNMDLIRNVDCPVWVVPEGKKYRPLRSIIYATDYNEEDIKTMQRLTELAKIHSATITALHVNENFDFDARVKNSGFKDELAEKVGYGKLDVSILVQEKDKSLSDVMNEFANMVDADLIVVLKENRNFFNRLFTKSKTKQIIGKAEFPVLVYHEQK
jgi:nucleotide-binding universal stress UspA family protein